MGGLVTCCCWWWEWPCGGEVEDWVEEALAIEATEEEEEEGGGGLIVTCWVCLGFGVGGWVGGELDG